MHSSLVKKRFIIKTFYNYILYLFIITTTIGLRIYYKLMFFKEKLFVTFVCSCMKFQISSYFAVVGLEIEDFIA